MNRPVNDHGFFLIVFTSIVAVMATATHTAAEPIALSATLTLDELIGLSDDELAKVDIAALNLACADGLPGSQHIDRKALLAKLDVWAGYVAYETQRNRHRFEQHPDEYNNSWGEFAMFRMAMTLQ
ncbi:MAG: hypothetical protein IH987_15185 [Planctomycetes bacterium]|nr:hypothetical protein [Planctomycetota bacterium]